MVSEYYGMQKADLDWEQQRAFFDLVQASFSHPDGPAAHEVMRFTDEAGETNAVVVAYWLDATRHARWSLSADFPKWFAAQERLASGDIGYWKETIAVPYDRHETIYSAPHYKIGFARTPNSSIEKHDHKRIFRRCARPGSDFRHRSAGKPFAGVATNAAGCWEPRPQLRASTPHNMTALRSGQYWVGAGPEQLGDYQENLQPKLMRGMNFLLDNKQDTGTLALRVMTNLDDDGKERAETSVLAYFSRWISLRTGRNHT